jgi:hypothetical protein
LDAVVYLPFRVDIRPDLERAIGRRSVSLTSRSISSPSDWVCWQRQRTDEPTRTIWSFSVAGRQLDGHDVELATWTAAQAEDWLGRWAKKSDADQRVEAQAQAGGFLILFSWTSATARRV